MSHDLVRRFFDLLGEGDVEGWLALMSDDVAADTPFSPTGAPTRFDGIGEIEARFGDARRRMDSLAFHDVEVLATEDPTRFVATCSSTGSFPGGIPYANTYCWIVTVVDGRITHWTEYFDPQAVLAAQRARAER
ncbi:MAG: nuclear transport factor 2 family protein [Actinomycetota bacterium]